MSVSMVDESVGNGILSLENRAYARTLAGVHFMRYDPYPNSWDGYDRQIGKCDRSIRRPDAPAIY